MTARRVALTGLVIAGAVLALVLVRDGSTPYKLSLLLDNAGGLRSGSAVTIGGIPVGKVDLSVEEQKGKVRVDATIERRYAPVGKDVTAEIVAQNLLGQKRLQLTAGDTSKPAPSGTVIPKSKVTVGTDLDQVLNVLDADTRTRLAIFINEAGAAVTGRRADFNKLLDDLQPALGDATTLLDELAGDNRTLGNLVSTTDRYIERVTTERRNLVRLVDRVGGTSETVAAKRAGLRQTIAEAPASLRTLRRFLDELRTTTVPLGPAARQVSASAPPLRQALEALDPFREAAVPALETASDVAPLLTRLGARATPVLKRAIPTLSQVRETATRQLPGVSSTVEGSIDNTLAVLENWSRAIQYRDGLSHIFRGEGSFERNAADSAVERLMAPQNLRAQRRSHRSGESQRPIDGRPDAPRRALDDLARRKLPAGVDLPLLPGLLDGGDPSLRTEAPPPPASERRDATPLLDFLLGP